MIGTYDEALDFLEGFIGKIIFRVDPKTIKEHDPLQRMRVLLDLLDNPQNKFKSVLIGGTSGKGSTAYLISHILKIAGYKTGLTISPHLQRVNERLQINGRQIPNEKFTDMVSSLVQTIELMKKMKVGEPSYFEILIAMAFLYFVQEKVDIAVVEVGMGGEYDATNTLNPLIAVLTNVTLDHTNILGKTVQKIAKTKAGIIKSSSHPLNASSKPNGNTRLANENRSVSTAALLSNHDYEEIVKSSSRGEARSSIVITGVKQSSVIKIVESRCKEVGAKLYRLGKDFRLTKFEVSLLGDYQKENASLAIETVLQLRKFGFKVSENEIGQALKTAFFPGRFEVVRLALLAHHKISSTLILDGAHNPTKMRAFLISLKKLFPKEKKIFVVGFKNDKEVRGMFKQIVKVADYIVATEFRAKTDMNVSASAEAESIRYEVLSMKYRGKIFVERDSKKALKKALSLAAIEQLSNRTMVIVTGSLYLVGEIRSML
ncbi:bifunctional folylpolyglutamate synthase/dihydrofolate synthase [Candidatus Roizmanbacteria bacterium]|nr:bifunctional folylpolyglutamate synthase/dihydrofolate synthase [Candidatus Roizmanbacteria bacterium]